MLNKMINQNSQMETPRQIAARQSKQNWDQMHISSIGLAIFIVFTIIAVTVAAVMDTQRLADEGTIVLIVLLLIAIGMYFLFAIKVANQWEGGGAAPGQVPRAARAGFVLDCSAAGFGEQLDRSPRDGASLQQFCVIP